MKPVLSGHQVRLLRLRAQRLVPGDTRTPAGAAAALREVFAVQAQDAAAASLSLRARSTGLTARDVDRAVAEERSVVRTWCMRGTLHLVPAEDVGWLLSLLGPRFSDAYRRRRLQLGLDDEACERGLRVLRHALADHGPLTRAALRPHLAAAGVPSDGQALPHLLLHAALLGVICQGPGTAREPAYVLLDDWLPERRHLPRDAALAELARRYLDAYAPAGPDDFAAWSGLPAADVRAAWRQVADGLLEVDAAGRAAWLPGARAAWLDHPPPAAPAVRLIPAFDTYLLGYRSRDLILPPEHAARIQPGGGLLHPAVLVDGLAAGVWSVQRRRDGVDVIVEPFGDLAAEVRAALEAEAADAGRFLETRAVLVVKTGS